MEIFKELKSKNIKYLVVKKSQLDSISVDKTCFNLNNIKLKEFLENYTFKIDLKNNVDNHEVYKLKQ